MQHMLHHLAPTGSMALLLANGSMSSNTGGEGEIRKALVEADVVECLVALPGQLFTNAAIPACIWFLTKKSKGHRAGQILFIDARKMGYMKDRVLRDFTSEDIAQLADTFHRWQNGWPYQDVPGFCKSARLEDVHRHEFVLTPGRYCGSAALEENGEPLAEKLGRLRAQLQDQFRESERLRVQIERNLDAVGGA